MSNDQSSPDPPAPAKRRLWGCWFFALGLPFLMCSGMAGWWFARRAIAQVEVDDQLERLREGGLPVDNESLEQFRAGVTQAKNADRWMRLLDSLNSQNYRESAADVPVVDIPLGSTIADGFVLPDLGEPWPDEERTSGFLELWSELREELHALTEDAQPVRTHIQWEGVMTQLPYVQRTRQAARLLTLEHHYALHKRDGDQCFQSVMSLLGTARILEGEPISVSQLTRFAIVGLALDCLQRSLEYDVLSDDQLNAIDAKLAALDDFARPLELTVAGERVMLLTFHQDPRKYDNESLPMSSGPQDVLKSLEWFAKVETISQEDYQADSFLDALENFESEIRTEMGSAGLLGKIDSVNTVIQFPALTVFGRASVRTTMRSRFARTAIGIRRYQHVQNAWPESLEDLEKIEVDMKSIRPNGGLPFGYRVVDGKAHLWAMILRSGRNQTPKEPPETVAETNAGLATEETWYWKLNP